MFWFLSAGASWSAAPRCHALWGVVSYGIARMVHGFVHRHKCFPCFAMFSMARSMVRPASRIFINWPMGDWDDLEERSPDLGDISLHASIGERNIPKPHGGDSTQIDVFGSRR
jgi:hypothetical protein